MDFARALASAAFAIRSGNVPYLHGAPGVGKSDMVRAIARDLSRPLVLVTPATMETVDWRGLPRIGAEGVEWSRPDFVAELFRVAAGGAAPILFIDEANAAGQANQVPLMQLTLERRIGPHALPAGTSVILAGNRVSDRAAAQRVPTALANRVVHIDVEPDLKAWLKWASGAGLDPVVMAFLMLRGEGAPNRPGLLHCFDPSNPDVRAFPSPRSWEAVARMADAPDEIRHGLIAGTVGPAAAGEFEAFRQVYKSLPPIMSILADPNGAVVPGDHELGLRFAVSMAIARAANHANIGNVLAYAGRLGKEFSAIVATDVARRDPTLCQSGPFIQWAAANGGDVL